MAILYMEGFESYGSISEAMSEGYDSYMNDAASGTLETGRDGTGQALRLNTSNDDYFFNLKQSASTVWGSFAYRTDAVSSKWIMNFYPEGNKFDYNVNLSMQSSLRLTIYNRTSLLATSDFIMSKNRWYHIEFKITIADSGTVDVWIDGIPVFELSGVDTKYSTYDNVRLIALYGNSNDQWYDDIIIGDDSGSGATDNIGDAKIERLTVDGAGSSTQFTPDGAGSPTGDNYQNIDDASADGDTTYNYSSTVGHKDFFTASNLSTSGVSVHAVGVHNKFKRTDAGLRSIRGKVLSNVTEGNGTTRAPLDDYLYAWDIFETDPDTSSAWTESGVNSMEIGYEVVS